MQHELLSDEDFMESVENLEREYYIDQCLKSQQRVYNLGSIIDNDPNDEF